MKARRTDPIVRTHEPGPGHIPGPYDASGKRRPGVPVYRTSSGLMIGCRWTPPARDQGKHAEHIQSLLLFGRQPLAWTQVYVAAMCAPSRRP